MNVAKYTFQSPSSSPVQVGRPDLSLSKEAKSSSASSSFSANQTQGNAKSFHVSQEKEVTPSVTCLS